MPLPPQQTKKPKKEGKPSADSDELLLMLREMLQPVIQFHADAKVSAETDVHLFWDIRAVKGGGDVISHLKGSSTMSGLLGPKLIVESPALLLNEVSVKISQPLVAEFQSLAESHALDNDMPGLTPKEMLMLGTSPSSGPDLAREMAKEEED